MNLFDIGKIPANLSVYVYPPPTPIADPTADFESAELPPSDIVLLPCPPLEPSEPFISSRNGPNTVPPMGFPEIGGELARIDNPYIAINPFAGSGTYLDFSTPLLMGLVQAADPRVIGLSAGSQQLGSAQIASTLLRAHHPAAAIVLGGWISLHDGQELLGLFPGVDVVYHGDAERRAGEVFRRLRNDGSRNRLGELLADIPGLTFRTPDGAIQNTGPHPSADISAAIPDLGMLHYWTKKIDERGKAALNADEIAVYLSRGCEAKCSFCSIVDFHQGHRAASLETVETLFKNFSDNGIHRVFFTDDNFLNAGTAGRLDGIAAICRKYNLQINFQTRAANILRNKAEITRNKDVIYRIAVGAESFSATQLKRYNKACSPEQNKRAAEILSELGIPYDLYLIAFDPEVTPEELLDNIAQFSSLSNQFDSAEKLPNWFSFYSLNFFLNTLKDKTSIHPLPLSGDMKKASDHFKHLKQCGFWDTFFSLKPHNAHYTEKRAELENIGFALVKAATLTAFPEQTGTVAQILFSQLFQFYSTLEILYKQPNPIQGDDFSLRMNALTINSLEAIRNQISATILQINALARSAGWPDEVH